VVLKLKHLLRCPAPLCVLAYTALIFGSLNSFKLIIIPPWLWVSESLLIVPGWSPALQLPDSGAGVGGKGILHRGGFSSSCPHREASVELQALAACLQAAPPKGKRGRQVAVKVPGFASSAEEFQKTC